VFSVYKIVRANRTESLQHPNIDGCFETLNCILELFAGDYNSEIGIIKYLFAGRYYIKRLENDLI
jgi:hypothetical protein